MEGVVETDAADSVHELCLYFIRALLREAHLITSTRRAGRDIVTGVHVISCTAALRLRGEWYGGIAGVEMMDGPANCYGETGGGRGGNVNGGI